jgi:hypothetical protein
VASGALNPLIAPFVGVFVLKLQFGQFFGEVTFQTLTAKSGGQMFWRVGAHRLGPVPG